MADMWDIARYIEDHPDDHEQRWRLAKKLYMAWEYRLALEHLQILSRVWSDRLNVVRYLAAVYYRLGRYEESVNTLRGALATWPADVALHEQLGRVLEVAGRREEAADVWEALLVIAPDHPIAATAAKRLREKPTESSGEKLSLADSDSGIDLRPGGTCANCGAQNSDEFDRCWQCHAPLTDTHAPTPRPLYTAPMPIEEDGYPAVHTAAVVALAVLAALAAFLTARDLLYARAVDAGTDTFQNMSQFLRAHFAVTRAAMGAGMLAVWPFALWLGLWVAGTRDMPGKLTFLTGAAAALFAYVLTWLPQPWIVAAPFAGLALAFVVLVVAVPLSTPRKALAWAVHAVVAIVFAGAAFAALERGIPISEFRAIEAHAASVAHTKGSYPIEELRTPATVPIQWPSTGSAWLDAQANIVFVQIKAEPGERGLTFEFRTPRETLHFADVTPGEHLVRLRPNINQPYLIIVTGAENRPFQLTVKGVLAPEFGTPVEAPPL